MRDERKFECGMIRGGREARSSSFLWRDAGILDFSGRETRWMMIWQQCTRIFHDSVKEGYSLDVYKGDFLNSFFYPLKSFQKSLSLSIRRRLLKSVPVTVSQFCEKGTIKMLKQEVYFSQKAVEYVLQRQEQTRTSANEHHQITREKG